jgi:signal transduction histidine kinase
VDELVRTYGGAWANLELQVDAPGPVWAHVGRDMLRHVLVNLCDNSAHALGQQQGVVQFALAEAGTTVSLEVAEDGPGIDPRVADRVCRLLPRGSHASYSGISWRLNSA